MTISQVKVMNFNDASGYIGQSYFYGPVTVKNTGSTNLINLKLVIDSYDSSSLGDHSDYFTIFEEPNEFSLKAGEKKTLLYVYQPKKLTSPEDNDYNWFDVNLHIEDSEGNQSDTERAMTILVRPEKYLNITQSFKGKWVNNENNDEMVYSYRLNLKSDDIQNFPVKDWFVFFNLPHGAYVSPVTIQSVKDWLELVDVKSSVNNTALATHGDGSHVIQPGSDLNLDIQIIYPGESADYESLKNLAFNFRSEEEWGLKVREKNT